MFISNIYDTVNSVISTNRLHVECHDDCIDCFYQFGQERVGAILRNGIVTGYKTKMIPSGIITEELIRYCIHRISAIK